MLHTLTTAKLHMGALCWAFAELFLDSMAGGADVAGERSTWHNITVAKLQVSLHVAVLQVWRGKEHVTQYHDCRKLQISWALHVAILQVWRGK